MNAYLVLANGMVFAGKSIGCPGTTVGEVVFATGMVGFEETLTDPSYYGQIITQTYPLIGNYGMNSEDLESDRVLGDDALFTGVQRKPLEGHDVVHPLGEDGALAQLAAQLVGIDDAAHGRSDNDIHVHILQLFRHGGHHFGALVGVLLQKRHLAVSAGMAAAGQQKMAFQESLALFQDLFVIPCHI